MLWLARSRPIPAAYRGAKSPSSNSLISARRRTRRKGFRKQGHYGKEIAHRVRAAEGVWLIGEGIILASVDAPRVNGLQPYRVTPQSFEIGEIEGGQRPGRQSRRQVGEAPPGPAGR